LPPCLAQQSCECIDAQAAPEAIIVGEPAWIVPALLAATNMLWQPSRQPAPAIQKATASASTTRTTLTEESNLIVAFSLNCVGIGVEAASFTEPTAVVPGAGVEFHISKSQQRGRCLERALVAHRARQTSPLSKQSSLLLPALGSVSICQLQTGISRRLSLDCSPCFSRELSGNLIREV
jgi:hypothetical protein